MTSGRSSNLRPTGRSLPARRARPRWPGTRRTSTLPERWPGASSASSRPSPTPRCSGHGPGSGRCPRRAAVHRMAPARALRRHGPRFRRRDPGRRHRHPRRGDSRGTRATARSDPVRSASVRLIETAPSSGGPMRRIAEHMPILAIGISHRRAPVELLERLAFAEEELPKAYRRALDDEAIEEAVILSTCNRVEIYGSVPAYHAGFLALKRLLCEQHGVDPVDLAEPLYSHFEEDARRHLFAVAAGLDSMVTGEPQILAQVRQAHRRASAEGAAGPG